MPEINSVNAIRNKLTAFDAQMDGAIDAATTLARAKTQADKMLAHITQIESQCNTKDVQITQLLEKAETASQKNHWIGAEWMTLRSQLVEATQTLDKKLQDAEERLKAFNQNTLAAQATTLSRLAASTQAHAEATEQASADVTKTAAQLEELLITLADDLSAEVQDKHGQSEKLLDARAARVESELTQLQQAHSEAVDRKAENYQRLLREEMTTFKAEVNRQLEQHQLGIDRRLTEFLGRQNTLVQNLAQQIDGFNRASQAQSAEITRMAPALSALSADNRIINTKIGQMAEAVKANKEAAEQNAAALLVQLQSLGTLQTWSQDTVKGLAQTLEKLRQLPIYGKWFK